MSKKKPKQPQKPSLLEQIRLRKRAAKIRKAERRGRPGPQEEETLGKSWQDEQSE